MTTRSPRLGPRQAPSSHGAWLGAGRRRRQNWPQQRSLLRPSGRPQTADRGRVQKESLTRPGQARLAQQLAQLLQRSHLTHAHIRRVMRLMRSQPAAGATGTLTGSRSAGELITRGQSACPLARASFTTAPDAPCARSTTGRSSSCGPARPRCTATEARAGTRLRLKRSRTYQPLRLRRQLTAQGSRLCCAQRRLLLTPHNPADSPLLSADGGAATGGLVELLDRARVDGGALGIPQHTSILRAARCCKLASSMFQPGKRALPWSRAVLR
jgi:hypothetical protein